MKIPPHLSTFRQRLYTNSQNITMELKCKTRGNNSDWNLKKNHISALSPLCEWPERHPSCRNSIQLAYLSLKVIWPDRSNSRKKGQQKLRVGYVERKKVKYRLSNENGSKGGYFQAHVKKGKGSLYSITERKVPELIRFLAVSLQVTWVINSAVGCHYFPPGLQLPSQRLRELLPVLLLGEQTHDGCEQFA